jgi:predicted porin
METALSTRTRSLSQAAALAAALAFAAGHAQAQSSVTISGTLDVGARQVRNGSLGSISSEVSGSNLTSKLVIRGVEDLGGGLRAGFLLDSTVLADAGAANTPFWDRQSTVGLSHADFGELRLGRDWVPTHLLWTSIDPFATLGVASANTFRSVFAARALGQAFGSTADAAAQNPTLRVNNAVEYFLPGGLGGAYGALMVSAGEGGIAGAGATRGEGGRFGWANAKVNVAVARYRTRNANAGFAFTDDAWGGSYDFGVVRVSLGQRRWTYRTDRLTNTLVAASVPLGSGVIKLTAVRADQSGATSALSNNDATLFGAGYVYNLSKRTALYGHAAQVANKAGASFAIPGGPATSGVSTAANYFGGMTSRGYEVGLRHNF